MPMKRDKGRTEKDGGSTGAQKATFGSTRTPEVAEAAADALGQEAEGSAER